MASESRNSGTNSTTTPGAKRRRLSDLKAKAVARLRKEALPLEGRPYLVQRAPHSLMDFVNPRRGVTQTVPGLDTQTGYRVGWEMLKLVGLEDRVPQVTAEAFSRPVPHCFKRADLKPLADLFTKHIEQVAQKLYPRMEAPTQTYNKESRLGWPVLDNPPNKQEVLEYHINDYLREGVAWLDGAFVLMNVRLQDEPIEKEREFMFADSDETVLLAKCGSWFRDLGHFYASRTRLVFNQPVCNLAHQIVDNMLHKALLKFPVFKHNVFSRAPLSVPGPATAFDCSHFERSTAACAEVWWKFVGGMYGDVNLAMLKIPLAAPSLDWKEVLWLWVNGEEDWLMQFASGNSIVAPLQKLVFGVLGPYALTQTRGISFDLALDIWLQGGDSRLQHKNYGDDNIMFGDQSEASDVIDVYGHYVKAVLEDPPRFLGMRWDPQSNTFKLDKTSYVRKTYLNERRPGGTFRPYPNYGWVEKRKTYLALGDQVELTRLFRQENDILAANDLPWEEIERRAAEEQSEMSQKIALDDAHLARVLEKEYLLTDADKLATGEWFGFNPAQCTSIIRRLLPESFRRNIPGM